MFGHVSIVFHPITMHFQEEESRFISLYTRIRKLKKAMRCPFNFLFLRLSKPRSVSLFLYVIFFSPMTHLVVLHWCHLCQCYYINVLLKVGSPKMHTVFHMWSHACQRERKNHLAGPVGYTSVSADKHACDPLCCKGTLPIHVEFLSTRIPRSFSAKLSSSKLDHCQCCCMGIFHSIQRAFYVPFWKFMGFLLGHFSTLLKTLWTGLPVSWWFLPIQYRPSIFWQCTLSHQPGD